MDTVSQVEDGALCGIYLITTHSVDIDIAAAAEAIASFIGCFHVFTFITCRVEWHLAKPAILNNISFIRRNKITPYCVIR